MQDDLGISGIRVAGVIESEAFAVPVKSHTSISCVFPEEFALKDPENKTRDLTPAGDFRMISRNLSFSKLHDN